MELLADECYYHLRLGWPQIESLMALIADLNFSELFASG